MKKLIFMASLITISMQATLIAQEKKKAPSATQSNFNMDGRLITNRHWIYFPKKEKMIIEMHNTNDYALLKNPDSLLTLFMHDISFYKDSLNTAGSVRIDYEFTTDPEIRKIRFKKYEPDGDIFISKQNDIARLKIDQDTVRLIFQVAPDDKTLYKWDDGNKIWNDKPIQVTFCLNNYSDINKLLEDKGMLNHIIDTLASSTKTKHKNGNYSSVGYRPFDTSYPNLSWHRFTKLHYELKDETDLWKSKDMLTIVGGVGAGVVKNTITPMADIGVEINGRSRIDPTGGYNFLRLSATPYFFFDKNMQGNTIVQDNWFANLEFGFDDRKKERTSIGIGYLYAEKGNYFQKTTMKVFVASRVFKLFTISPELIINDNFKQVYPGITVKMLNLGNSD